MSGNSPVEAPTPLKTGFSEMSSSVSFSPVRTGFREKRRFSVSTSLPTLNFDPHHHRAAHHRHARRTPWLIPVYIPIPCIPAVRRLRLLMPNPSRLQQLVAFRPGRASRMLLLILFAGLFTLLLTGKHLKKLFKKVIPGKGSTLVFQRDELQRIWHWEVESGHYPSSREIPEEIGLIRAPWNPALAPSRQGTPHGPIFRNTIRAGPRRVYVDIQSQPPHVAYPPRPVSGSVADLDVVMDHCDFSKGKYVRDCLEVLRIGGGLDVGARIRRGNLNDWKYIYMEEGDISRFPTVPPSHKAKQSVFGMPSWYGEGSNAGLTKKRGADWEPPLQLPRPVSHHPYVSLPVPPCDENNPRIFHMFWTGPFTDKPYLALLSYLYTQNTGVHLHENPFASTVCRPQFWLWINPGPAASVPNPNALRDMYEQLQSNPWASPFLHPRFHDVIKFKLWNTTEQLDGVPEIRHEWRSMQDKLFNSGGWVIKVPTNSSQAAGDDMASRVGSASSATIDKLSTVLSDMARFVLCHRFGGVYLDADTIMLRDWEELWGWKGAFAYRWSRLPDYNTAVLRMNKGSALGSFIFRTALRNGMDFHPMTVSRYTRDAHVQGLLLRLPDALFDPAWLNTEKYQRDRPPQPYFTAFEQFFDTPAQDGAAPHALGFDGFFKGAYSYHFHNFWWKAFDPARHWPDLGPRFIAGEQKARAALLRTEYDSDGDGDTDAEESVADDKRDLDWATVLKRTFEAYVRGERPNMYGEWIDW